MGSSEESETKLRLGITQMHENLYGDALTSLIKAINLCPCRPASHGKDKSCNISQCIRAVRDSETDPDSFYRIVTGPCSCGFKWPSCTRPLHLEAVDTLAACLEKAKRYAAAFSTTLGLIRLDPASPIGYCRITNIIRYLVKDRTEIDHDVRRSLSALLRDANLSDRKKLGQCLVMFVKCGLHNAEKYRHSPDDKYHVILRQMAHRLKLPQSRKDFLTRLPPELIHMIFAHLDTPQLVACCRVSKVWRQSLEADTLLWASINLARPRSSRYFAKFLQRHRTVRNLSIQDCSRLNLSVDKLTAILRLPRLQCLQIASSDGILADHNNNLQSIDRIEASPLTKLSLSANAKFPGVSKEPELLQLVKRKAATLEDLELCRIWEGGRNGFFLVNEGWHAIVFPNLRKLCLIGNHHFDLAVLNNCAPNLEHLYVEDCAIHHGTNVKLESLRRLSIGSLCYLGDGPHGIFPCLPRTMQVIELLSPDPSLHKTFLFGFGDLDDPEYEVRELPEFPCLEVFRSKYPPTPDWFKQLLSPALQNGSLKVLEFSVQNRWRSQPAIEPAKEYPSAASDQVHTIGLYDYAWAADSYTKELDATPFLEWLNRFPNVKTVTAYPDHLFHEYRSTLSFFSRLIAHPNIEVIHQDGLQGVEWDRAQELAKARGVKLFHTPEHTRCTKT
ncbi:hypothetical protein V8F20_007501 [Naviculisporaceae sp. PSN 640]